MIVVKNSKNELYFEIKGINNVVSSNNSLWYF